ncbi:MAG: phospho-sugar mutase [Spirochaetales bacterium]|jgi:phosphoglucomutase|nr:phospho-sugar mutase [Spirochaetales bacterium]
MESNLLNQCREYLDFEEHPQFRQELQTLIDNKDEKGIRDRFYTQLAFGTGGLRGVIGAGYNRMNPYMVKRATQGLANYILKQNFEKPSAVIAYDSRNFSPEFSESAALVLCANNIRAFLFSSLRPTPELSYAVRVLNASAGIVVTASHNPPEYNGYKVYWSDGGQIVPPHDEGILSEVHGVSGKIESMAKQDAVDAGLLTYIDSNIDHDYLDMIDRYLLRPELLSEQAAGTKVVYTPLHGTGAYLVEKIFNRMGVSFVTVPEQREPDGAFPTVKSPNPEEAAALKMALDLGKIEKADLIMGTDPDADRLGVAVKEGESFLLLSGNQLGSLLCDYIFKTRQETGTLPEKPVLVKTIVTTDLQTRIAESYGAKVYNVLTGFKYIGEKIRQFEETGEGYVFGGEESYGYLVETEARDKDAISTAALAVELAVYNRSKGKTIIDHLHDIYARFGFFDEILISKIFEGEEGKKQIADLMSNLRNNPPNSFGGQRLVELRDYQDGSIIADGVTKREVINLPGSNVLQFQLESGVFSARPSGTEPKIKFYVSCWTEPGLPLKEAREITLNRIGKVKTDIETLIN